MYKHAPENYDCPLCRVVAGLENDGVYTKRTDIIYQDDYVTAFISSRSWPNNAGHVIVIPNQHFENIYDIPDELLAMVQSFGKQVAIALKQAYQCDGTSFRQHNEPAGNQDAWHYHLHVFPRYENDELYSRQKEGRLTTPEERAPYAERLRNYFGALKSSPTS